MPWDISSNSLELVGVKEALRELNKMDKKARLQITRDYKAIVSPIIQEAQAATPVKPPLSGMEYSWKPGGRAGVFPWQDNKSDRSMKAFVSGKRPRVHGPFVSGLTTFGIRWTNPDALVIEMSGKGPVPTAKGKQMVADLNRRYGLPGRFLWKAYLRHEDKVIAGVQEIISDLMRQVNRKTK
jgi:hypothetical protein